jgi:hypothetical protein
MAGAFADNVRLHADWTSGTMELVVKATEERVNKLAH